MKINSFEDAEVWQKSRVLSQRIFELTQQDKFFRDFSLRDQINRAAGSVMDNVAEGFERGGNKELIQFLSIAKGSAGEVRSQLYRARDRGHVALEEFDQLKDDVLEVSKKLSNFITYLKRSDMKGAKYTHDPKSHIPI